MPRYLTEIAIRRPADWHLCVSPPKDSAFSPWAVKSGRVGRMSVFWSFLIRFWGECLRLPNERLRFPD